MKKLKLRFVITAAMCLALTGLLNTAAQAQTEARTFTTFANGEQEIPFRDTPAQGYGTFQISADGNEIRYRVVVANATNIVAAHLHNAPVGVNGLKSGHIS
jgi:ABC-type glycerol-3-phosphate transport system substrate-binding protein